MAISADIYYEALRSFSAAEGTATKGQILKGGHTLVSNHEPLWIEIGKTEAEKLAAIVAAGLGVE